MCLTQSISTQAILAQNEGHYPAQFGIKTCKDGSFNVSVKLHTVAPAQLRAVPAPAEKMRMRLIRRRERSTDSRDSAMLIFSSPSRLTSCPMRPEPRG